MSTSEKTYTVVRSDALSSKYDPRFVVVDCATGKVLDDAQGYGYKSVQNAYAGFGYKNRDRAKDAKKLAKHRAVHKFCKEHRDFVDAIEQSMFEITKGSWGPDAEVNAAFIRQCFSEGGFDLKECGFTAAEFLRYKQNPQITHRLACGVNAAN